MNKTVFVVVMAAVLLVAGGLWFVWSIGQAYVGKGQPTVDGPETPGLTASMHRKVYAVTTTDNASESRIDEIDPRTRQITPVLTVGASIVSLSQAHGSLLYMVVHIGRNSRHELRLFDGSKERTLRAWSSSFYPREANNELDDEERGGTSFALSPDGKLVAMIIRRNPLKTEDGEIGGRLVLLNLATGKERVVVEQASDQGVAWFPDNRGIAFVCQTPANALGNGPQRRSVISRLDLSTNSVKEVCSGVQPTISEDGDYLLSSKVDGSTWRIESLRDSSFVELPDTRDLKPFGWYTPIGIINSTQIVALASPTKRDSSDEYRKESALKILDFGRKEFETITESYDGTVACYGN